MHVRVALVILHRSKQTQIKRQMVLCVVWQMERLIDSHRTATVWVVLVHLVAIPL